MSELILAYGIGGVSTLIFVLIGCALEQIETRKIEAFNLHISLDNERKGILGHYYDSEVEEKKWRDKKMKL